LTLGIWKSSSRKTYWVLSS